MLDLRTAVYDGHRTGFAIARSSTTTPVAEPTRITAQGRTKPPKPASTAATTPTALSMINARVSLRPDPARTVSSANTSPSLAGRPSSPVRLRGRPSLLMTDRLPEPRRWSRDEFAPPAASYAVEVSP